MAGSTLEITSSRRFIVGLDSHTSIQVLLVVNERFKKIATTLATTQVVVQH